LSELLGYDFIIEFKKGKDFSVANALSHQSDDLTKEELCIALISFPTPTWMSDLNESCLSDQHTTELLTVLQRGDAVQKGYSLQQGLILHKGRLWVVKDSPFQEQLLTYIHSNPTAGHLGYHKTIQRAKTNFSKKGMRHDIKKFVRECTVCQENKHESVLLARLLQPLPTPSRVWSDIAMNFIEGLLLSLGFSVILVVIDRFSKYGHFLPLAHPYTASKVAQMFLTNIFKLHGMPTTIVSDRDPNFTSSFWRELFQLQGISLPFSSAYHPQSDGKMEALNKCLETYLRCYVGAKPKD
jgi:hypothetical protein